MKNLVISGIVGASLAVGIFGIVGNHDRASITREEGRTLIESRRVDADHAEKLAMIDALRGAGRGQFWLLVLMGGLTAGSLGILLFIVTRQNALQTTQTEKRVIIVPTRERALDVTTRGQNPEIDDYSRQYGHGAFYIVPESYEVR